MRGGFRCHEISCGQTGSSWYYDPNRNPTVKHPEKQSNLPRFRSVGFVPSVLAFTTCSIYGDTMTATFTHLQATSKLGLRVISLHDFADIPTGSIGQIIDVYERSNNDYGVMVRWENGIKDGFSRDEYERFLREV